MKVRLKLNSKLRAKYTEWSYKEIYMALSHRTALPGRTGDLIFFSAAVSPSLTDLFPTLLMGLSAFFLCFLLLSAFFLHCSTTDWMLFPPPVWALLYKGVQEADTKSNSGTCTQGRHQGGTADTHVPGPSAWRGPATRKCAREWSRRRNSAGEAP